MTDKKEQLEILSRELLGKLKDVSDTSELFFPFDYVLPEGYAEKYFAEGTKMRALTVKSMIIIDNSFKKFQIFPTHDIMITYVETQKDLLKDWVTEALEAFIKSFEDKEPDEKELDEFKSALSDIETGINKASMAAIKAVGSSDEAKMLDREFSNSHAAGFADFIHNTISNLFK